jgi:hypothetical protein
MPKMRIGMPARKAWRRGTAPSVTAVPRSGCRAMSTSGTTVIAPAISRSFRRHAAAPALGEELRQHERQRRFANSEGCRLRGPKSIQRRDPPRTTPRKST